ncbi:MAG: FG-GAP repeat domain-containing protein [Planctomycetota bacterium]
MPGFGDAGRARHPRFLRRRSGARAPVRHPGQGRLPPRREKGLAHAVGDFDGDRKLDLVILQRNDAWLLARDGQGRFRVRGLGMNLGRWVTYTCLAASDADRDGGLDLILGAESYIVVPGVTRLFLNDGKGSFMDAASSNMPRDGNETSSLALGDVDGDKDLDLVIGNGASQGARRNRPHLGDGKGSFSDGTAGRLPALAEATWSVALADVDGDLDLVVGNSSSYVDRLHLNDGKGVFTLSATALPAGRERILSLEAGDPDGDGDPDLFLGGGVLDRLYLKDGRGRFTSVQRLGPSAGSSVGAGFADPSFEHAVCDLCRRQIAP